MWEELRSLDLMRISTENFVSVRTRCCVTKIAFVCCTDNLFPDLQMAIFSFEPRRGSLQLPASIVFQQGAQKSCQLIFLLFPTTERLSEFNYQPIKRCFLLFTDLDAVRIHIVWKLERRGGVESLEHFLFRLDVLIFPPQWAFCCVPRGHEHNKKGIIELSRQIVQRMFLRKWFSTTKHLKKKKKKRTKIIHNLLLQHIHKVINGVLFGYKSSWNS